jgi:hypothetical protein
MTDIDRRIMLGLAGVAGAALATRLAEGGSLNPPPGPITPTGKTTDQIEPRIDLLNAPASANVTSDANNHYIINNPGSYYLSANLGVTKTNGIVVQSRDVVLDFGGFTILRTSGSGGVGILVNHEAALRNGSLRGFDTGVNVLQGSQLEDLSTGACVTGFAIGVASVATRCIAKNSTTCGFSGDQGCILVDCATIAGSKGYEFAQGCVLTRCSAAFGTDVGFGGQEGCTLESCTVISGGADPFAAFQFGDGCALTRCSVAQTTAQHGFSVGAGCLLQDCLVEGSSSGTALSSGFQLAGSTARGCVANNIQTSLAAAKSNGAGFTTLGDGNVFEACVARGNAGAGFYVQTNNVIARCQAISNAFSGIEVFGSSNVVEQNRLLFNAGNGVLVDSTINLVFGNCARGNTAGNYSVVAGNRVGTIVLPATNAGAISGNSGGSAFTTDPYANIAF